MTSTFPSVAVLLVNLGSPEAPTKKALRVYLKEFLSDPRVIDLARWKWLPILYGIVLNTRPRRSAHAYQQIWRQDGAPLIVISAQQTEALRQMLVAQGLDSVVVEYAMRYGNPSISEKLQMLASKGITRLLVIPMYPQYSDATTASVFDGVAQALAKRRAIPELRVVREWHVHPRYISALADSIRRHFQTHGQAEKLLFSFHGVPKRYIEEGDPYRQHCQATVQKVVEQLGLPPERYLLVFQSRFGNEEWLKPYADETIRQLAEEGCQSISVICPGFSADCLETLEEMAMTNRALFLQHGGKHYDYIPALNDDSAHIALLADLVAQHIQGWEDKDTYSQETAEV
ncbi:MAG: ferrochelatase [Cardiobacteriaceae bacterium]|nr:ferrochelatase [Cardiobacteriaceae bacterium]